MGRRGRNNLTGEQFFFVTTSVISFVPIFRKKIYCDILINNIKYYQTKYKFHILAYVIMPSHFHWIVKTEPQYGTISEIMRDIKKFTAWQILDKLKENNNIKLLTFFKAQAKDIKDQRYKLWMSRFDDQVIRNEKMFWQKVKYIHNNPVEAGLVFKPEDYLYSSARNYIYRENSVLNVDTDYAGIEL